MSVGKRNYISRLQTLLVYLFLNGTAKTKLAILPLLGCGEIVKNPKRKGGLATIFQMASLASIYS